MHLRAVVLVTMTTLVLASVSMPTPVAGQRPVDISAAPAAEAVLLRQRTFTIARARRQPVSDLLADSFVEIQWHGGMLTRAEAIEHYTDSDDVSGPTFSERQTASFGNVATISDRTAEEGTPYHSRRLYIWVKEDSGAWRLLLFQRTFMLPRSAKLGPHLTQWPAQWRAERTASAEETALATRNPGLARPLLAADGIFFNGHGERLTAEQWSVTLDGAPSEIRFLHRLYAGDAFVLIGEHVSPTTVFPRRFTHIWTQSPAGLQLRLGQTTYQALEDFNPDSSAKPVIPQT